MSTLIIVKFGRFLTSHLAGLRGCSPNTVASYRDTFKLLIAWFRDERSIPPGKLTLDHIDAGAVTAFLGWLQEGRRNGVSTRAFDMWMTRTFPDVPFERYVDDGVVHCVSQQQAEMLRDAIGQRMVEVGLKLHPGQDPSCLLQGQQ